MNQILTVCFIFATTLSSFAQPERDKGLSLHMLPDRVARISNTKGGFTVSAPTPKEEIPAMDDKKVMDYFQQLPEQVKKNGIWVVYTHPSSYSDKEKKQLKELVEESKKQTISIFTCRASELNNKNWKAAGLIE